MTKSRTPRLKTAAVFLIAGNLDGFKTDITRATKLQSQPKYA